MRPFLKAVCAISVLVFIGCHRRWDCITGVCAGIRFAKPSPAEFTLVLGDTVGVTAYDTVYVTGEPLALGDYDRAKVELATTKELIKVKKAEGLVLPDYSGIAYAFVVVAGEKGTGEDELAVESVNDKRFWVSHRVHIVAPVR